MTLDDLQQFLTIYGPGLEAELVLLRRLEVLALEQHAHTDLRDVTHLTSVTLERDRIMAALVTIEAELRPAREALAQHREEAATLESYAEITELHKVATELVATIIHKDRDTVNALQNAEVARRLASQTVGTAGSTLAAYRRVLAPPLSGASLVNRRG
jgi:hypothetical protein